jgi:hypothetical protein
MYSTNPKDRPESETEQSHDVGHSDSMDKRLFCFFGSIALIGGAYHHEGHTELASEDEQPVKPDQDFTGSEESVILIIDITHCRGKRSFM